MVHITERGRIRLYARALFLSNAADKRVEARDIFMLDHSFALGLRNRTVGCLERRIAHNITTRGARAGEDARASFLSNTAEERVEARWRG